MIGAVGAFVALDAERNTVAQIGLHVGPTDGTSNPAKETVRRPIKFGVPAFGKMIGGPVEWPVMRWTEKITHFSLWTDTGVFVASGQLDQPVKVNAGDGLVIASVTWTVE